MYICIYAYMHIAGKNMVMQQVQGMGVTQELQHEPVEPQT